MLGDYRYHVVEFCRKRFEFPLWRRRRNVVFLVVLDALDVLVVIDLLVVLVI
jgi:hypothetical protein